MAEQLQQLAAEQSQAPVGTDEGKRSLGDALANKFTTFKRDRQAAENQWLQNVRQILGKYDEALEQNMEPGTSRAYPKLTRAKCISMVSRLMALLFPAGEKNWSLSASPVPNLPPETMIAVLDEWRAANPGVNPTQVELDQLVVKAAGDVAELQETMIDDQLKDVDPYCAMDYETLVRRVVYSAVFYGPGVMKGPMTVTVEATTFQLDAAGAPQVVSTEAYRPYFEFVSCWDYYPDMSASTFSQLDGEFQRHVYSRHQLSLLAKRPDFDGKAIRDFITRNPDGNYQRYNYETQLQGIGTQNANPAAVGGKYELLEYWGSTTGSVLRSAGLKEVEDSELEDDISFTAWILDRQLVKLNRNPFPDGTKVYHQFVFEEDEVNLLGSGLPPIMRDSQLAVSSFSRMLLDNASVVCGPNVEVNTDNLSPAQTDMSIKPRKVWLTEGSVSGQRTVQSISFDSHIPELIQGINLFSGFADAETFVNPVTGGDLENVPGEAMRTTGGASMVYANAALPFRDVVRNFDQFTVSVIDALVKWNRIFSESRDKLQGDTRPIPRGATSLMAKEVRAYALDNLANTLTEDERIYLDSEEMFKQRIAVRDLPLAQLMASPEVVKQRMAARDAKAQTEQQNAASMFAATLKNLDSDTIKQLTQAQKNLDAADVAVFKAFMDALNSGASTDDLTAIARRASAARQSGQQPISGRPSSAPGGGTTQGLREVG